jgi:hypothetical protein
MKTIAIDISESVFDNETEAIMYVTKDDEVEPLQYIFAIPAISFSWSAKDESELQTFFPVNVLGEKDREKALLNEMKKAIRTF